MQGGGGGYIFRTKTGEGEGGIRISPLFKFNRVGSKKFSLVNPFNAAYRVFVCQPKRNDTITRRLRSHLLENFAFVLLYSIGLDVAVRKMEG